MNSYYVSKNGVPCKIAKIGLNSRGVLMPCAENEPFTDFGEGYNTGKRKAARAIDRTIKVANKLRASVISDWSKISGLVLPGQYKIEKRIAARITL
jgi:hypothetical protein